MQKLLLVILLFSISCTKITNEKKYTLPQLSDEVIDFNYSSRPAHNRKANTSTPYIAYINFSDYNLNSMYWNNGLPVSLSHANLSASNITTIMANIKASYVGFNITITTDSLKYKNADTLKRQMVIITDSHSWFSSNYGGVSYVGSMFWGYNAPCFVFSGLLGNNVTYISRAASHELGHTIGLYHQSVYDSSCNMLFRYNSGTATNAPIMGVAYGAINAKWWVGQSELGCYNIQNDTAVIIAAIGKSKK